MTLNFNLSIQPFEHHTFLLQHVSIDGIDVVLTNLECDNGIIHELDCVLCGSVGMDYYDCGGNNS
jgi:hypothetical protein